MKLRQAKKIMRNVRLYKGMIWIYGAGRVDKANERMLRYHSAKDENFKRLMRLIETNPLVVACAIANRNKMKGIV